MTSSRKMFNGTNKSRHNLQFGVPNNLADRLNVELIHECKTCTNLNELSYGLRDRLELQPIEVRRYIVNLKRDECAALFIVCKRGNALIAKYLILTCGANMEQRGMYEVPEDRSVHCVTPLWCAAVSGQLEILKCLVKLGANINSVSDTGSTPIRSACYMSNLSVVEYLSQNGGDIKKPNYNGGTCLINSVQSDKLCLYLIQCGADINAKDIQDKTALHYAIQEHSLDTAKLLIDKGANPFAQSRYGDDCLQTACLKGSHPIFDFLKKNIPYSNERLADAHELIGTTFLDEHNETRVAILHWRLAHHIRMKENQYIEKKPQIPLRQAYGNAVEFTTLQELDNIAADVDAMRIQSLMISERILGIHHKDNLFRLMFRGASYADSLRYQRCIDLWILALEVRVTRHSILYSDTCFTAQALVRLMLDLQEKKMDADPDEFIDFDVPRFEDVLSVFTLLTQNIFETQKLLQIRPVHRKQQEHFDRVLKCITHVIYLLVMTAFEEEQQRKVYAAVRNLVVNKLTSACTVDTLLHLCVSSLNEIRSGYFTDDRNLLAVFPSLGVINLLLNCGADTNAVNESKSTPLHVASVPYNYDVEVVQTLLNHGAHLDQPNRADDRPSQLIAMNPNNTIPLINYITLKCLSATVVAKYNIPYRNQIPKTLEAFVELHKP